MEKDGGKEGSGDRDGDGEEAKCTKGRKNEEGNTGGRNRDGRGSICFRRETQRRRTEMDLGWNQERAMRGAELPPAVRPADEGTDGVCSPHAPFPAGVGDKSIPVLLRRDGAGDL